MKALLDDDDKQWLFGMKLQGVIDNSARYKALMADAWHHAIALDRTLSEKPIL